MLLCEQYKVLGRGKEDWATFIDRKLESEAFLKFQRFGSGR